MYKSFRYLDTNIHIYEQESNQYPRLLQSSSLYKLSGYFYGDKKIEAITNCSYFNSSESYVLGRNQGDLSNGTHDQDGFWDIVLMKDGTYHLGNFKSWDYCDADEVLAGFSAGAILVKDGEDVNLISTAICDSSKTTTVNPQTAIAIRSTGKILLIVSDGRTSENVGITGNQLREYIKSQYSDIEMMALLDGGGSSEMIVDGTIKNVPSDGSERKMLNGLAIIADTSKPEIKHLTSYTPRLSSDGITTSIYYNRPYSTGDMPNCTTYALFRACEILERQCTNWGSDEYPKIDAPCFNRLGYGNAGNWYKDWIWEKGSTPKLGAIISWSGTYKSSGETAAGHVAVVEKINDDGSFVTSNSNYKGTFFYTMTIPADCSLTSTVYDFTFEGFCYLPIEIDSIPKASPVDRNRTVNQIQIKQEIIRVRTQPNTSSDSLGLAEVGYYNVLDTSEGEGYTWYNIADQNWVAGVNTQYLEYLPAETPYTISITVDPSNSGTTTGSGNYYSGDTATIKAIENDGYEFDGWHNGSELLSESKTYSFQVTSNLDLTSKFKNAAPKNYTITIQDVSGGTSTGAGTYLENTEVTISTTANDGYVFKQWEHVNGSGIFSSNQTVTFNIGQDLNLIPVYEELVYNTLTLTSTTGGSTTGTGRYLQNTRVTATAIANEGYDFIGWYSNDEQWSTNLIYEFNITEDTSLEARFSIRQLSVSLSTNNQYGSVSGEGTYDYNEQVTIVATPSSGYSFSGWYNSSEVVSTNATYTFTIKENKNLISYFSRDPVYYSVAISSNNTEYGTVTGSGTYLENTPVRLVASPKENYKFVGWQVRGQTNYQSTQLTYTFNINSNIDLIGVFEPKVKYTINATSSDDTLGTTSGSGEYYEGTFITISATATAENAIFSEWEVPENPGATILTKDYSFTVTENLNIRANFKVVYDLIITKNNDKWGTVTGQGKYTEDSRITITASPASGYSFKGWYLNNVLVSESLSYSFNMGDKAITYDAVFSPIQDQDQIVTLSSEITSLSSSLGLLINNFNADYTYKFYWFDNENDKHLWNYSATSKYIDLPIGNDIEKTMSNVSSATKNLYVEAWEGEYLSKYQYSTFKVLVPSTYNPKITIGDIGITDKYKGIAIAGISKFSSTITCSLQAPEGYTNSATLNDPVITYSRGNYNGAYQRSTDKIVTVSGTLDESTANYQFYITVSVTDSRGNTVSATSTQSLIFGYYKPEFELIDIIRCKQDGTESDDPTENTYCKLKFNFDLSSVDGLNSISTSDVKLIYEEKEITPTLDTSGNFEAIFGGDLHTGSDYQVTIKWKDNVMKTFSINEITYQQSLEERIPLSLLQRSNSVIGVGLGVRSTTSNLVQMGLNSSFSRDTKMLGSTSVYDSKNDTNIIKETTKPAYDIISRGGINSVCVLDSDIEKDNYANNLRVVSSNDYTSSDKDSHTLFFLTDVEKL